MKKLSLIMSLVLVLTALCGLFAVPTSAADDAEDIVATVNGVEATADNLLDVIMACPYGGTIEILEDFSTFSLLLANGEELGITSKWVINGNGKTISSPLTKLALSNYLIVTSAASVEINDLTIKTMGSGIKVMDGSQVTLNRVNVYSGGTKAGLTVDASNRDHYGVAKDSAELHSVAVNVSATTRSAVYINGGVYKAYGVSGQVLAVNRGNVVVTDGYFVGEDCSFVARVQNAEKYTDLSVITASLTIYGGTFIKPVIDRKAGYFETDSETKIPTTNTDGAVLRGDAGGLINVYGGKFACFSGTATRSDGTAYGYQRDFVVLGGISTNTANCVGFINIFGGDFYSFMTSDVTGNSSQLIGNFSGSNTEVNSAERVKVNTSIYGGNFYSTVPSREANIKAVADKAEVTIQHVPADQYRATTTAGQSATVYGKTFSNVTKWAIEYVEPTVAPSNAVVKVTNSDNKTYYIADYTFSGTSGTSTVAVTIPAFAQAVNGVAGNNSTVTLLKNITITPTEILNRGQTMTLDGNNNKITSATNAITVSSGNITIKNLTIEATGGYALKIAKTAIDSNPDSENYNVTVDSFKLNLVLENCAFIGQTAIINNPFLEGSVAATGCTANGSALQLSATYTAPEPVAPDLDFEEEEEEEDDDNNGTTETTPDNSTDAPATDSSAPATDAEKKGCNNSIGVGAIAIIAVAGAACGFVAKKRED